nr:1209_t:CDS:2 [Entrophospora candida]
MVPSNYSATMIVLTSSKREIAKSMMQRNYLNYVEVFAHYIFEWKKKITIDKIEDACSRPSTFQQYKVQFVSFIIRERIYQKFLNEQEFSLHNFLKTCEDESIAGDICGNLFDEFSHKMLKGDGKYEIRARRRKSAMKKLNLAQKFQTKQGKNAERTPQIVHSIKQYSLKVPLDANMVAS